MTTPSNPVSESPLDSPGTPPAALSATRPLYWSVRRELWEHRSVYMAPLAVASIVLFGFLISSITLPQRLRAALLLDPAHQRAALARPYDLAAILLMLVSFLVGVLYCLEALHGERRDRSILFWKSLPVSDLTTVLSKAFLPLVAVPLLAFAIVLCTQMFMLVLSTAVLLASGLSPAPLWTEVPFVPRSLLLLYALTVVTLWHAPLYAWLLLVSGWARRTAFLWAVLPLLVICIFERIAFRTFYFASLLGYRLVGWFKQAFVLRAPGNVFADPLTQLTPGLFLSTPGLWLGLGAAALFLALAARLRRQGEPL